MSTLVILTVLINLNIAGVVNPIKITTPVDKYWTQQANMESCLDKAARFVDLIDDNILPGNIISIECKVGEYE